MRQGRYSRKRFAWLAAAAIVAAGAVTIPLLRRTGGPLAPLTEAAPRSHRLIEARLAGFRWARLEAPARGNAAPDPADLHLAGAAGDVLEQNLGRADATGRHAVGVADLLIGRTADSLATLEQAAGAADAGWDVWNDLAAARHTRAVRDGRPSELPEALADADRALRLRPQAPEALFNRALIIEAMGLREQARAVWRRFLAADASGDWSLEAREHQRRLEVAAPRFDAKLLDTTSPDAAVEQFPQETRREAEGRLLAAWADAEQSGDAARAAAVLARARAIGDALARFRGEHLLADAVAAIDRAQGATRTVLAEAYRTYRSGRISYSSRQAGAAEKDFRRAAELFAQAGSPFADVTRYYAASAAFDQGRREEACNELQTILARIDAARHRAFSAEVRWELTVCANTAGDWGAAAREADAAAATFRALGERRNAAYMDGLAAMAIELIGESDLAWQRRLHTFAELSASDDARLGTIIHSAAMTLAAVGRTGAAASIVQLLGEDEHKDDPAQLASTSADAARYAARSGDNESARQSLAMAQAAAGRVADAAVRRTVRAQIALAEATLGNADPNAALFTAGQSNIDLPDAYLQRARALRRAGDEAGAAAQYAGALQEVEKQRTTLRDAESRLRFLDVAAQIIEETTDLRLAQGDVRGAFAVADRARMLIDPQPIDVPGETLPPVEPGMLVIEYAVLPRSVVAFCLSNSGLTAERIAADRNDLELRIASFAERIRRRAPVAELRGESASLYRLLIEPLQSHLTGVQELVIVPDRQLHALPFAALWDASRQQYLIEQFTLRFAPTAALHRSLPPWRAEGPALVVADPPAAGWPPLPASREEAAGIAAMYRGSLLVGPAATREAFIEGAKRSALIHFAGHANSDATASHGALLLAASGNDSGLLGAGDVARLKLERSPLVVLAACGSLRGDTLHVNGMSSLSRAFLIAGARGVTGTLWEIDDDVSSQLFVRLHAHLRAGEAPSRALREAQLEALRSTEPRMAHPATWSPVELLSDI